MFLINYYKRKKLEIDIKVQKYREKSFKEIESIALRCAEEKGEFEHDYHSKMEELGIEIAKQEARKLELENDEETYKSWLKNKDEEIARLNTIIIKMVEKGVNINHYNNR